MGFAAQLEKKTSDTLAKYDPSTNQDARAAILTGGVSLIAPQEVKDAATHGAQVVSDNVSHWGKVISDNPVARAALTIAAAYVGVPPNVMMLALGANDIGQGKDPEQVAKTMATNYLMSAAAGTLNPAATSALKATGIDMSPATLKAAATTLSSAGVGALRAGLTGKDILQGAGDGAKSGAISAAADYAGGQAGSATGNKAVGNATKAITSTALKGGNIQDAALNAAQGYANNTASAYISKIAKDNGLDSIDIGGYDIKGNIIPGVSASDAKYLASLTPGGKNVINKVNTVSNVLSNKPAANTQSTAKAPTTNTQSTAKAPTANTGFDPRMLLALMASRQDKQDSPEYQTAKVDQKDVFDFLNANTPGDSYADLINMTRRA